MWLKVWRDTSAMAGEPHYSEYESEEDIKLLLNHFEEEITNWDGYHDLEWEKVDLPPREWLERELFWSRERLAGLYSNYKQTRDGLKAIIKKYRGLLREVLNG